MDEFKPEDELKPNRGDRHATGRSRQASERDDEPRINFDDIYPDSDDRRPGPVYSQRNERDAAHDDEPDGQWVDEEVRPGRQRAGARKPASRQYMMMGIGILVLLLLIIAISSALKVPTRGRTSHQTASPERSIDLSATMTERAKGVQTGPGETPGGQNGGNDQQDVALPPVSAIPAKGQFPQPPEAQRRIEVQGNLNNALTQPQNQSQINNMVSSTLPTAPATVGSIRNGNARRQGASTNSATPQTAPRQPRGQVAIEPKLHDKPRSATPRVASAGVSRTTDVGALVGMLKAAPPGHYTLQLSGASDYNNLNNWAKKADLKNYVVYKTTRNGQPWFVLVSGVYASKEEAKRAVATLPADVRAQQPWAKPLSQVQADLK